MRTAPEWAFPPETCRSFVASLSLEEEQCSWSSTRSESTPPSRPINTLQIRKCALVRACVDGSDATQYCLVAVVFARSDKRASQISFRPVFRPHVQGRRGVGSQTGLAFASLFGRLVFFSFSFVLASLSGNCLTHYFPFLSMCVSLISTPVNSSICYRHQVLGATRVRLQDFPITEPPVILQSGR